MRERLWLKPLVSCFLSIAAVLVAGLSESFVTTTRLPEVSAKSLETLLTIISASMLVIAMFAVGAMLSAYASASSTATPRSFPLVVSDDVSQNALSTFIGAFIFSIVGLVALLNGYYGSTGRFILFIVTLFVFSIVVLAFVHWVDRIARLGRLGHTIEKVESAADAALQLWAELPTMGAKRTAASDKGEKLFAGEVGYVQNIDLFKLQRVAEDSDCLISVCATPGSFVTPDIPIALVQGQGKSRCGEEIIAAFLIGRERTFESDPRYGLVVLSEIASRALSPAVNDPGTAIDIIGSMIRLFVRWTTACGEPKAGQVQFDRISVPALAMRSMFDDAFGAIARDGASSVEVAVSLQKAYLALSRMGIDEMTAAAEEHSKLAVRYAEKALPLEEEVNVVRSLSREVKRKAAGDAQPIAAGDA